MEYFNVKKLYSDQCVKIRLNILNHSGDMAVAATFIFVRNSIVHQMK